MSDKTILVWFRNDLRVHDNEILFEALQKADKVLPLYCFDPFYFKTTNRGLLKTGQIRTRFLLESVAGLRDNLRKLGGELIIRLGDPAEVLPQLAQQYQVSEVYHHREVAFEETAISEQVETALWKIKLNLKHFIGHTLFHKEDLPFPIKDIPDSFTVFKKKLERDSGVRPCIETPQHISIPGITDPGELPSPEQLGLAEASSDARGQFRFKGGEETALDRLQQYIADLDWPAVQKGAKHNGDHASGLSPWISLGCLSQRMVYHEVMKRAGAVHAANQPLILELFWRDYFRFMFKKHGIQFFSPEGFKGKAPETGPMQDKLFEKWKNGQTGSPYVDAVMHELNATGYISNHNRQAAALFLVEELKVDWTRGAAYFEEKLIDYSPASNWGNWSFIAGVGNDTREGRYFASSKHIDQLSESEYISTWLPGVYNEGSNVAHAL